MFKLVNKYTDSFKSNTDQFSKEHKRAYAIFRDDKPVDEKALQYAVLKCCNTAAVYAPNTSVLFQNSPEPADALYPHDKLIVSQNFNELEEYNTRFMGVHTDYGFILVPTNPAESCEVHCVNNDGILDCDAVASLLEEAYNLYCENYTEPDAHEYTALSCCDIDFIRTQTKYNVVYYANIGDFEKKARFAKMLLRHAIEGDFRKNMATRDADKITYDASYDDAQIYDIDSANIHSVQEHSVFSFASVHWSLIGSNIRIGFDKENDAFDYLMKTSDFLMNSL